MHHAGMNAFSNHVLLSATSMDVLAAGRATPEGILARQQSRLASLLYTLAQGSSLYARHLHDYLEPGVQLHRLPVFTKAELMERFDEWVTDPDITLEGLRSLTADPQRIGQPYLDRYVVWESSGSSGQPAIFVQDAQCMAINDALESLRRSPFTPAVGHVDAQGLDERIAFVGVTTGHFASIVQMRRLQMLYPWAERSIRNISILQPMASVVQELNAFEPTIVATYPSVAIALAGQREEGTLCIAPHAIWTGGENLSAASRARVAKQMHCTVRDHYGASEFLSIASECSCGHLHANTDWLILEPVDEKHHPVPPGHASATTLLTHLGNRVQPILRYDLGDRITVSARPCDCGSPLPVIQVSGRNDPPLQMRGTNGKPVVLLPLALTTVLEEQAGLYEFQVHQRDDHTLELQVPQTDASADASLARGQQALKDFAQLQGVVSLKIIARSGVALQRGKSGKVPRVIDLLHEGFHFNRSK
jgi:phenylacetate-coenzyme A ligase PaaK-like adenylate-forming protein